MDINVEREKNKISEGFSFALQHQESELLVLLQAQKHSEKMRLPLPQQSWFIGIRRSRNVNGS